MRTQIKSEGLPLSGWRRPCAQGKWPFIPFHPTIEKKRCTCIIRNIKKKLLQDILEPKYEFQTYSILISATSAVRFLLAVDTSFNSVDEHDSDLDSTIGFDVGFLLIAKLVRCVIGVRHFSTSLVWKIEIYLFTLLFIIKFWFINSIFLFYLHYNMTNNFSIKM